ncbi:MAG: flagellar export protein FliJ [Deltaproteobacteria bacterium]|jgi:flagellar FliJ protein|nr:flagellar export protein FliJ [Deltaproteobacteria bacterium]MDX9761992.1 flagellar export protein FliJ [Desulfomonilia bacterium]
MGFRFRFETLLKVRKIREELALQEFSKAQRLLNDLENIKGMKVSRTAEIRIQLMERMDAGIKPFEVGSYHAYLARLKAEIEQVEKLIAQAGRQLETKRQELLKAKKELKAIDRLREIDGERFRQREQKLDMRFMDELAIQRYRSGQ